MTLTIALVSVLLAAVAAAGILRPFSRGRQVALERLTDPLEDERRSLLRALKDLDEERATGQISEQDHAALRADTEVRAVAVLRALEARDGSGGLVAGLQELRIPAGAAREPAVPRRARPALPVLIVAGVLVAAMIPLLVNAVANRGTGQPITGDPFASPGTSDLSAAVQRVQDHPTDVAARLDLARRYIDAGDDRNAAAQYLIVLQQDPRNVEAHAALGMIVYRGGKAQDGLTLVQQALAVAPKEPEALYDEGIILLDGLDQPQQAAVAFRAYLDAAPFGSHRDEVRSLLDGISSAG